MHGAVPLFGLMIRTEAQRLQAPVDALVSLEQGGIARRLIDPVVDFLVAAVVAGQVVLHAAGQHRIMQRFDLRELRRRDALACQLTGKSLQAAH
ncbi:hypothetical protein D3C72_1855970 [compost metagenome]